MSASREIVIHLTDRPPVRIVDAEWPVVGRSVRPKDHPEKSRDRAYVRVRRHADGRALVYGLRADGPVERKVGQPVGPMDDLAFAVRQVCSLVDVDAQEVFDSLPPESL